MQGRKMEIDKNLKTVAKDLKGTLNSAKPAIEKLGNVNEIKYTCV